MPDDIFKKSVKNSFFRAKQDVDSFKANMNEWILYLQKQNERLQARIDELEDRTRTLEKRELLLKA